MPKTIYEQLHSACFASIESYHNDLVVHDKEWLEKNPEIPFLHWTRRSGTSLQPLWSHDAPEFPPEGMEVPYLFGHANRIHIVKQIQAVAEYWKERETDAQVCATHYFDGKTLFAASPTIALKIASEHVRNVQACWYRNHPVILPQYLRVA